jgi:hypothetical protein
MFLVFSEMAIILSLSSGSERGQVIGIAESEQTSAGNLFSRDFLVDNEQQNTNCLSFQALFPHVSYPFPSFVASVRQGPALLLIS